VKWTNNMVSKYMKRQSVKLNYKRILKL
jgi:hypothetical protein